MIQKIRTLKINIDLFLLSIRTETALENVSPVTAFDRKAFFPKALDLSITIFRCT
jgi:hypothetical protein